MIKLNVITRNKETKFTTVLTDSGMWLAYFDNKTNTIANGETEKEAIENLKGMLSSILNENYNFTLLSKIKNQEQQFKMSDLDKFLSEQNVMPYSRKINESTYEIFDGSTSYWISDELFQQFQQQMKKMYEKA